VDDKVTSLIGDERLNISFGKESLRRYFEQAQGLVGGAKIQAYLNTEQKKLEKALLIERADSLKADAAN
jgi:hypothetical protein